jgi:hypothetical protein
MKYWERTMRSAHWPEVEPLGDIARQARWRGKKQLATPPVADLEPIYSATIS